MKTMEDAEFDKLIEKFGQDCAHGLVRMVARDGGTIPPEAMIDTQIVVRPWWERGLRYVEISARSSDDAVKQHFSVRLRLVVDAEDNVVRDLCDPANGGGGVLET